MTCVNTNTTAKQISQSTRDNRVTLVSQIKYITITVIRRNIMVN